MADYTPALTTGYKRVESSPTSTNYDPSNSYHPNFSSPLTQRVDAELAEISLISKPVTRRSSLIHQSSFEREQSDEPRLTVSLTEFQSLRGVLRIILVFVSIVTFSSIADVLGFSRFWEFETLCLVGVASFMYNFALVLTYLFIDSIVPAKCSELTLLRLTYRFDCISCLALLFAAFFSSVICWSFSSSVCRQQASGNIETSCVFGWAGSILFAVTAKQSFTKSRNAQVT